MLKFNVGYNKKADAIVTSIDSMDRFRILKGKGYNWQTFIYIIQDDYVCKFGITNNIERRQRQYSRERPSFKLKYCKPLDNRNIARLIEYNMKRRFTIISGSETTRAPIEELIDFIESSNTNLEQAILELPESLQPEPDNSKSIETVSQKTSLFKSYSLEEKRKEYKNAYFKWTKEDDERLGALFCSGTSIMELSEIFGRNYGAIHSRLKKLGLKDNDVAN